MAITGIANDLTGNPKGIFSFSVAFPSFVQIGFFLLGLVAMCLVILGVKPSNTDT